ncbi:8265_t:CDS:2 [Paraglomus brasilianum]|uniref:8265_t:CDS:1 n=1 Tax=Paraglomus brasilianum TaxID=144538 RepID=A0A9N8W1A3_9GLOM|nr:8265_t:CDS:2 [Paraglomus brasilianum]
MGYEVRDIKNGVGSRDSNFGSRDYTGDIQTLWQDFDRLFKEKRRLEKRTEPSMYSKISEEIRELWVDNERELDTEVEAEENSDSAGPSGTSSRRLRASFGADFHWCTSFPSHAVALGPSLLYY